MTHTVDVLPQNDDPRMAVFLDPKRPEIFHSVATPTALWQADPFDVESIHSDARAAYEKLLHRVEPHAGKILVVEGDAGSGKTHLMRAFRTRTHANGWGYCGYLQMTTQATSYPRYILSNLLDSLQHPYAPDGPSGTGLARLSAGLLDAVPNLTPNERLAFRNGKATTRVDEFADKLQALPAFNTCDLGLLRVLLYLQTNDAKVTSRALMWLRCENMKADDCKFIGDATPRTEESDPARMLQMIAHVTDAVHRVPLVLLIDQVEDMNTQEDAIARFIRLVDALLGFTDNVPNGIVVLACLKDYFHKAQTTLARSKVDRLLHDPAPVNLRAVRTADEAIAMTAARLTALYEAADVVTDASNPLYPFEPSDFTAMKELRTRDVLHNLHDHHRKCIDARQWSPPKFGGGGPIPPPPPPPIELDQLWNTHHADFKATVPDEEEALAIILQQAIMHISDELPTGYTVGGTVEANFIEVDTQNNQNSLSKLLVAICNKAAQGGSLGKQIKAVEKRLGTFPVALVRTTEFPSGDKTAVAKQIASILRRDGRRVQVHEADWRRMLAFASFLQQHGKRSDFKTWQQIAKPLSEMDSLQRILKLNALPNPIAPLPITPPIAPPTPKADTKPPVVVALPASTNGIRFGRTDSLTPAPVFMQPKELTYHAGFLGGTGSGKTTAALNIIEQLLAQGIPAVLLDRKGDLCRYAETKSWERSLNNPERTTARTALREMLDVNIYTPGEPNGRPLALPIVPPGFDQLSQSDRERFAQWAAAGLGNMLGFRSSDADRIQRVILAKAIETLASNAGTQVRVPLLREVIKNQDDALLTALDGGFDARHFNKLAERLQTLELNHRLLLNGDEMLDIDALLGTGSHAVPGRVRLSVVSTRFLGDTSTVDFWVAQFLVAIARWCAKSPQTNLQAVFMFDEADAYLPATRQPATKAPMEDLLKRARSAGVGIFLATQSPGDFDYKCRENVRTWVVGRIKETRAIEKLRPMFAEKESALDKLGAHEIGQFQLVREGGIAAVRSDESLMRTEQLGEAEIAELARNANRRSAPPKKAAVVV